MTGAEMIEQGNILIAKGLEQVSRGTALIMQELVHKAAAVRMVEIREPARDDGDWIPKATFCERFGISGQTADQWARIGKAEKIHFSSRKVCYRMVRQQ